MIHLTVPSIPRQRLWGMKNMLRVLPLLVALCMATPALGQESESQTWPEINAFVRLSGKTRLYFIVSGTRLRDTNEFSDGQFAGYLDFYTFPLLWGRIRRNADVSRNKSVMIRIGYMLDRTSPDNPDVSVVHAPSIESNIRAELPAKILLTDKNRMDFRIVNGDYRPRYRNRIKAERTFKAGRFDLNPYAYFEVFYDWHLNAFNRTRITGGMEWTLTRRVTLEGYYMRQHDIVPSAKYINGIGAVLQLYFR